MRSTRSLKPLMILLSFLALTPPAGAQDKPRDAWTLLTTQTLSARGDTMDIDLSGYAGAFKAIRLQSGRRRVTLNNVTVYYKDRSKIERKKPVSLRRSRRMKAISTGDTAYFLDAMTLEYTIRGRRAKDAKVLVWGLQSELDRAAQYSKPGNSNAEKKIATAAGQLSNIPSKPGDVLINALHTPLSSHVIAIPVPVNLAKFDKIRIGAAHTKMKFGAVEIVYASGKSTSQVLDLTLKPNQATPWLETSSDDFVKEVRIHSTPRPYYRETSRLELYGQFSENWHTASSEAEQYNKGWIMLGSEGADFSGFDQDRISVSAANRKADKLKLRVRNRAITLESIRVIYTDKSETFLPIRKRFAAGSTVGPIKIKRGDREISDIVPVYRSRYMDRDARQRGRAIVEIWAKHGEKTAKLGTKINTEKDAHRNP